MALKLDDSKKAQVTEVFRKRRNGPVDDSGKVPLFQEIHWAAHVLDPNTDVYTLQRSRWKKKLRGHVRKYEIPRILLCKEDQLIN